MVVGEVENLNHGVYRYQPEAHSLVRVKHGDMRREVADAALRQGFVEQGAVVFVLSAIYERTTGKYAQRGVRYVHMEAGHAAQNLLLQATALGLGAVPVGAFHDDELAQVLGLAENEHPLYVIPVGPGD
jgi:SagB-type dehydrogenase family enzyme